MTENNSGALRGRPPLFTEKKRVEDFLFQLSKSRFEAGESCSVIFMADKAMVQFELDVYPKGHEKVGQKIDKDKDPDAYEKRKEVVRQYIWPMVDGKLWHKRTPAAPDDRTRGKWKPARKKKPSKKK